MHRNTVGATTQQGRRRGSFDTSAKVRSWPSRGAREAGRVAARPACPVYAPDPACYVECLNPTSSQEDCVLSDPNDRRQCERFPVTAGVAANFAGRVVEDLGPVRIQNVAM